MSIFTAAAKAAPKPAAGIATLAGAVGAKAASLWAAWNEWRSGCKAVERLASLDDHMLRDIGLTRHVIHRAARFGRFGD